MAKFLVKRCVNCPGQREQPASTEPHFAATDLRRVPGRPAVRPLDRENQAPTSRELHDQRVAPLQVIASLADEIQLGPKERMNGHRDRHLLGGDFLTRRILRPSSG